MSNPYSFCQQAALPPATMFLGRLPRILYACSKLPHGRHLISGTNLENALLDSLPNSVRAPAESSLDILVKDGDVNVVGIQVKSMSSIRKSVVWRRITLENKLELIPASFVHPGLASDIGSALLKKFHQGFSDQDVHQFMYLQFMHTPGALKVIQAVIDPAALMDFLSSGIQWKWSTKRKGCYQSLEGYHVDPETLAQTRVFSWSGLSGNHFHICDMGFFLKKVSHMSRVYTMPLAVRSLSVEEMATLLNV